jgi:hypothetical protein
MALELQSLKDFGAYHVLEGYLRGCQQQSAAAADTWMSSLSDEMLEFQSERAWRLANWDMQLLPEYAYTVALLSRHFS